VVIGLYRYPFHYLFIDRREIVTDLIYAIALYLALFASLLILIRRQWTLNLLTLAVQFLCLFPILRSYLPFQPALIQPFTGLMVTLILYLTLLNVGGIKRIDLRQRPTSGELFRALAGILLLSLLRAFIPQLQPAVFPTVPSTYLFLSLGLLVLGILQLGTTREPFYLAIGILTFLTGFQLLYNRLDFSLMLEALLVAVNLLLAIVGAFFIVKDAEGEAV
jgi:hypothetical protein